jgi:glycosidase
LDRRSGARRAAPSEAYLCDDLDRIVAQADLMAAAFPPGHRIACAAFATAALHTWFGERSPAPNDASVRSDAMDEPADGGLVARLEQTFGGRFQSITGPRDGQAAEHWAAAVRHGFAEIEAALKAAGAGSAAVVALKRRDSSNAHVTVALYNDGPGVPANDRGIHYLHASGSAVPGEPISDATDIDAVDAFVLDRNQDAVPFPGRGRGLFNVLPFTDTYVRALSADDFPLWEAELHQPNHTASVAAGEALPAAEPDPLRSEVLALAEQLDELGLDTAARWLHVVLMRESVDRRALRVIAGRLADFARQTAEPRSPLRSMFRPRHREHAAVASTAVSNASRRLDELADQLPTRADEIVESDTGLRAEHPGTDRPVALDAPRRNRSGITYQVLTDRFARGSTRDEYLARAPESEYVSDPLAPEGAADYDPFDPADPDSYHGGDVAGLIGRLDYLAGLGIDTVWISPVTTSRTVLSFGGYTGAGHHFYWPVNFLQVDPRQATMADLLNFLDLAHERGVKVVLDMVFNHIGIVNDPHGGGPATRKYYRDPYAHYRDADGNIVDPRDQLDPETFREIVAFPHTEGYQVPDDVAPWWLGQAWALHRVGEFCEEFADAKLFCDTFGLADLFTEDPRVRWGLQDIALLWLLVGFDGFRYDTANHVNIEFWAELNPLLRGWARALGRDGFISFGEAFTQDPHELAEHVVRGQIAGMLDFALQAAVVEFATGVQPAKLDWVLGADPLFTNPRGNARNLVVPISSHDSLGHFAGYAREQLPHAGDEQILARVKLAYSLLYFLPRDPCVYHGDEQGFVGRANAGQLSGFTAGREDMFASQVAAYNAKALIGTDKTTAEDNYDTDHPIYRHLAALAEFVRATPALDTGAFTARRASSDGVAAFSRIELTGEATEHLVLVNSTTQDQRVTVPTYSAGLRFDGVFGTDTAASSAPDRSIEVSVPALSAVVYRAAEPLAAPAEQPTVHLDLAPSLRYRTPFADERKHDRLPLGATVSWGTETDSPAQVTFYARRRGEQKWELLGTADSPPYTVLPYTDQYRPGTRLEVKVMAKDLAGRVATDTAVVAVGKEKPTPPTVAGFPPGYAVVHYHRPDDDYEGWQLRVGDAAVPFAYESGYGRFAWAKLPDDGRIDVRYAIVHADGRTDGHGLLGSVSRPAHIWRRSGDPIAYSSQAAAQGHVTLHYSGRAPVMDHGYAYWGLHLIDGVAEGARTTWPYSRAFAGRDSYGVYARVKVDGSGSPVRFLVNTDGGEKATGVDHEFDPARTADAYVVHGVDETYDSEAAARFEVKIHFRVDGSGWRLRCWCGARDDTTPDAPSREPDGDDTFGPYWVVPLDREQRTVGVRIHNGLFGADFTLDLNATGHEVWLLPGAAPGVAQRAR